MTIQPWGVDHKRFSNTKYGALQYLRECSDVDLTDAEVRPLETHSGGWAVTTPHDGDVERITVLLNGHRRADGRIRRFNQFEAIPRYDHTSYPEQD